MSDIFDLSSSLSMCLDISELCNEIECDGCHKVKPSKRCSRCHGAYYCSIKCQKSDWKHLKPVCRSRDVELQSQANEIQTWFPVTGKQISQQEQEKKNDTCSICLQEPMVNPVVLPDCHHAFCFECLAVWQKRSNRCPNCRDATEKSIIDTALQNAMMYSLMLGEKCGNDNHHNNSTSSASDGNVPSMVDREQMYVNKALDQVNRVLSIRPNHVYALQIKGQILLATKPMQSLELFQKANAIVEENIAKPRSAKNGMTFPILVESIMIKLKYCNALISLEKYSQAFDLYEVMEQQVSKLDHHELQELVKVDPEIHCEILIGQSRCLLSMEEFHRAKHVAERAVELNRRRDGVHTLLAFAQWSLGEKKDAIRTMHHAVLYEAPWDADAQMRNRKQLQGFIDSVNYEISNIFM